MLDFLTGGGASLLGSLLGFGGSIVPRIFEVFQDRADRKHELDMLNLNMQLQERGIQGRLEETAITAEAGEMQALYRTMQPTGVKWVDALRGTVRPVLTFLVFGLFAAVKISEILIAVNAGADAVNAITGVWDADSKAIFATIISFWFGDRVLKRSRGK